MIDVSDYIKELQVLQKYLHDCIDIKYHNYQMREKIKIAPGPTSTHYHKSRIHQVQSFYRWKLYNTMQF